MPAPIEAPPAPEYYRFLWEVAGHFAFDMNSDPANALHKYHLRDAIHLTVIPHQAVEDIMAHRNLPFKRAIEEAVLAGMSRCVMPEHIKSVSCSDLGVQARIADLYDIGATDLVEQEKGDKLLRLKLSAPFDKRGGVEVGAHPKDEDGNFNPVYITVADLHDRVRQAQMNHNLRVNSGIDWQADVMGTLSTQPAVSKYIALTANNDAPAAGDTTLASEIASGTLARAIYTAYNHTTGVASYNQTKTFTSDQTVTINKAGEFNAASVGILTFETLLSPNAPTASGDTIAFTWTKNI